MGGSWCVELGGVVGVGLLWLVGGDVVADGCERGEGKVGCGRWILSGIWVVNSVFRVWGVWRGGCNFAVWPAAMCVDEW